ncbi:RNA-directed DNA polymerase, eukaryota, reverse transcriptase zinc-binding domain protein [Tanacetum coccineum]
MLPSLALQQFNHKKNVKKDAVKHWEQYHFEQEFVLQNDHEALQYFNSQKSTSRFVRIRWRTLQKYGNKMKQLFQEHHGELHDLVPLPKIPGYSIVAENFTEKIEAILVDVRLKLEASNAKYRRTETSITSPKIFAEGDLVMSSPFQMGENDEGDNLKKDYYLESKESNLPPSYFKETWQANAYAVWRNELIPTTILTLQIESVTASIPGKSACWPIVDDLLLNGVKYPKYSGGDVESKEIRVDNDDRVKEIRENSKEMEKSEIEGDGMENHESNDGIDTGKQNGLEEVGDDGEGMNKEVFGSDLNNGEKMVVFEEEMVREGSEKWRFTICGYFVGCKMGINELRYNVRRMWGRFGLKDIVVHADGLCYFKFKTEEGMNQIIDQSPWVWKDDKMKGKRTKWVKVKFTWRLESSNLCCVFGHSVYNCKLKPMTTVDNSMKSSEGFRSDGAYKEGSKQAVPGMKFTFVPKNVKTNNVNDKQKGKEQTETCSANNSTFKIWSLPGNERKLKESANNILVIIDNESELGGMDPFIDKMLIVDEFIKKKMQPTCDESKDWSYDMISYFKYKWKKMENKDKEENSDEEDVFMNDNQVDNCIVTDEIEGNIYGEVKEQGVCV